MALKQQRRVRSEDSESRSLLHDHDDTFTGPMTELRLMILGGDEDLMDEALDIIFRERAGPDDSETRLRKGHVCGRKITVVKTRSTWMDQVASGCCFESRVESIKDQMEDCVSQLFPGPHAFLLVLNNRKITGNEHYLLKAITKVFGKEALDYTMVLIIGRTQPKGLRKVRKTVKRVYTLEDNEQSVQSLFTETERMTQNKESPFFIQPSYKTFMKNTYSSWEKEKYEEIKRETEKPLKEKVADLEEKLGIAEREIDKEQQHTKNVAEMFKDKEKNLKEDIDHLKCLMIDTLIDLRSRDVEQKDEPEALAAHERLKNQHSEACKDNQSLFSIFSSITDGHKHRENELKTKMKELKNEKEYLKNMCFSTLDDHIQIERLKKDNKVLQKEVEQLKTIMKPEDREEQMKSDLARREENVTRRENALETKERQIGDKSRSVDERQRQIKGKDEDSPDYESLEFVKPVRRNSNQREPPNLTESDHKPPGTL